MQWLWHGYEGRGLLLGGSQSEQVALCIPSIARAVEVDSACPHAQGRLCFL